MCSQQSNLPAHRHLPDHGALRPAEASEGLGRSIIATARALSEFVWHMLNDSKPFDEAGMKNLEIRRKALEMQTAALEVA